MSALLWSMIGIIRRNTLCWSDLKRYFKGTIINLLFLVYPTILKVCFSLFACTDIEGISYLDVYMQDECWEGDHWTYATAVAIPALILWGIGLPCYAYYSIYQKN